MRFLNAFLSGIILLVKCSYVHQKYEKKNHLSFLERCPIISYYFFFYDDGKQLAIDLHIIGPPIINRLLRDLLMPLL